MKTCGLVPEANQGRTNKPGLFPFSVAVKINEKLVCSGTIIGPKTILTSASCVKGLDVEKIRIIVGKHNLASKIEKCFKLARVSKVLVHKKYNNETLANNLAIVDLKHIVSFAHYSDSFGNNNKICMPTSCRSCKNLVIASWTKKGQMKSMEYKVVNQSHCSIKRKDKQSLLCVDVKSGEPDDEYDLGAPLATVSKGKYYLVGLMNDITSESSFRKIINVKYYSEWIIKTVEKLK